MHTLEHDFLSEQKLKTHVQKEISQVLSLPSPSPPERAGEILWLNAFFKPGCKTNLLLLFLLP